MTNRTALFSQKQSGGVFTIADLPAHPGNIWFVDSGAAAASDSAGFGQNPDAPFATIDYAIGLCTASNGDVIYVMPGHAETLTTAADIAADVAGISIIGLGTGATRPTITFGSTDNAATWTVSADNVRIANVILVCNDDGLTNALVVTGDNADIDIEFRDTSATVETATAVRLDTANHAKLKLKYRGFTGGNAVTSAVLLDDCDNVEIDIDAYGVVSTAWVNMVDVASTNVSVRGRTYTQAITDGSRNVVDTITGSTWDAVIFDASAGASYSGGSAAAMASDDVTAVASAIAVIDEFHDVPAANNTLNAQINEVIGNKTDAAAAGAVTATDTLVGYIKQLVNVALGQEQTIVKVLTDPGAAANALFTITGGPILVKKLVGVVTTVLAGAANGTLQATTTTPSGTTALSTTVAIDNDAAGTTYRFVGATGVLTPVTAGAVIIDPVTTADCEFLVPIGNINFLNSGAQTGVITWYMSYIPLSPASAVAAA